MRINTLKVSFIEACKRLESEGFIINTFEKNITSKMFIKKIEELKDKVVYIDPHIENLLIFKPGTNLHQFCLKNEGFVLQDKVSYL